MQVGEEFIISQRGGDEEDGVGAVGSGFVELDFVDGEVFSKQRQF